MCLCSCERSIFLFHLKRVLLQNKDEANNITVCLSLAFTVYLAWVLERIRKKHTLLTFADAALNFFTRSSEWCINI